MSSFFVALFDSLSNLHRTIKFAFVVSFALTVQTSLCGQQDRNLDQVQFSTDQQGKWSVSEGKYTVAAGNFVQHNNEACWLSVYDRDEKKGKSVTITDFDGNGTFDLIQICDLSTRYVAYDYAADGIWEYRCKIDSNVKTGQVRVDGNIYDVTFADFQDSVGTCVIGEKKYEVRPELKPDLQGPVIVPLE